MKFDSPKVKSTLILLKEQFLLDDRPWVVTFSGGKDSTTVLHLVVHMLLELKKENMTTKKVFIVSSDTMVEMPIIEDYFFEKVKQLNKFIKQENLNMETVILSPKVTESFWTLLLGKGYPSPNQTFRWCTDRMKIRPATYFLTSLANKHKSIMMLLGVRSDESVARAQSIDKRQLNHRGLTTHDSIPNAFILSPIKDWSNPEVWSFLSRNPSPWGQHQDMMKLYDKGSGEGDCNIALNPESPSCGKTRFGCWVCTVVSKDKSMYWAILFGALGGLLTAKIGSGCDAILYFYLVFICHRCAKNSIPTTVCFMAINSLYASVWLLLTTTPTDFVVGSWWASAPVVSLGAPLGAYVLSRLKTSQTVVMVISIISFEVISSLLFAPFSTAIKLVILLTIVLLLIYTFWQQMFSNRSNIE